ncbi:hypothetical protein GRAN_3619 [Granulicella sibirica]|uniref:Uncharacterized protein n=2 Tax=Granulicella sibirica TaxID=2479048 RepID=A0A4Q0SZK3_9BACT|nr:hypothetical protein GRAN_3619 [Granulicella sibirica]
MQTLRSAPVPLLIALSFAGFTHTSAEEPKPAKPPKTHAVTLGPVRKVPYTPAETDRNNRNEESTTLKVRALFVDTRQREWTMGEPHDVTDRSFTVRRALRINDRLPTEAEDRWTWQPGPWLLVDRVTGHIAAIHLPDFDPVASDAVWFRDYAAYCGTGQTAKGGLYAVVAQLGARHAVIQKQIGRWPQPDHFIPVCQPAAWQRQPMRVTLQPTGGEASTFDIVGSAAIVEEGDAADDN